MSVRYSALLVVFFSFISFQSFAEPASASTTPTAFVTDKLFIYMHAGPSRRYKILGSLDAGTPFTVLDSNEETEFTQIKDNKGRSGWIESKYISKQASLALQLEQTQQNLQSKELQISQNLERIKQFEEFEAEAKQQNNNFKQQIRSLEAKFNQQSQELQSAKQKLDSQSQDQLMEWLRNGGMIMFLGVVLGYILAIIPKKKRRSSFGYNDL